MSSQGERVASESPAHRPFLEKAFMMLQSLPGLADFIYSGVQVNLNTVMQLHTDDKTAGMAGLRRRRIRRRRIPHEGP